MCIVSPMAPFVKGQDMRHDGLVRVLLVEGQVALREALALRLSAPR